MSHGTPNPAYLEQAALARIEGLQATLQVARALVESSRPIDLTGLDIEAARLCVAVGIMPVDIAHNLRPALEALRLDLDRLTAAFEPPLSAA